MEEEIESTEQSDQTAEEKMFLWVWKQHMLGYLQACISTSLNSEIQELTETWFY